MVYTPEILLELATGYKSASKSLLDSIDNFCQLGGTSTDVDVQEMIELGEFISRDVAKMSKLFRDIPASLVVNVLNIAFNVSKVCLFCVCCCCGCFFFSQMSISLLAWLSSGLSFLQRIRLLAICCCRACRLL